MVIEKILNRIWLTLFRFPIIKHFWALTFKAKHFENVPWTKLKKPLHKCKIVLISTGGIILKNDKPFDLVNPDGDISFRRIPNNVKSGDLKISHNYYDHRDADLDPNLILPFEVLSDLQSEGLIGSSNIFHYSFMGHIKSPLLTDLIKKSVFDVTKEIIQQKVDIALLVPA